MNVFLGVVATAVVVYMIVRIGKRSGFRFGGKSKDRW